MITSASNHGHWPLRLWFYSPSAWEGFALLTFFFCHRWTLPRKTWVYLVNWHGERKCWNGCLAFKAEDKFCRPTLVLVCTNINSPCASICVIVCMRERERDLHLYVQVPFLYVFLCVYVRERERKRDSCGQLLTKICIEIGGQVQITKKREFLGCCGLENNGFQSL